MNDTEALFRYRLSQALETLVDAEKMQQAGTSPRSVINRAYYAMFYAVLALLLNDEIQIKTSKHAGIISLFDTAFIHGGKMPVSFSKMLHRAFDMRQEADYREFIDISPEDASRIINESGEFIAAAKKHIGI
jgi:uncharacterized protein (UPF0332 family)